MLLEIYLFLAIYNRNHCISVENRVFFRALKGLMVVLIEPLISVFLYH